MTKTTLQQKSFLIVFGLLLALIILETGLRSAGYVILSLQERRNNISLRQKSECRIICFGESTTQGQYPAYLEWILNQRDIGIKFSVIDKGISGIKTAAILSDLEDNLDRYKPDLVVTMMGINDYAVYMPYDGVLNGKIMRVIKSFRTYKLIRFLWLHILAKAKEIRAYESPSAIKSTGLEPEYVKQDDIMQKKANSAELFDFNPRDDQAYVKLRRVYTDQRKSAENETILKKAIRLNPRDDQAYARLGIFYVSQNKFNQAEVAFRKAFRLNPYNDKTYELLVEFYIRLGKFDKAENILKNILKSNPYDSKAYDKVGRFYVAQARFDQAATAFRKAIQLNPNSIQGYKGLVWLYIRKERLTVDEEIIEAERALRMVLDHDPNNDQAYAGLGGFYLDQGRFPEAEPCFKKALELNPGNDLAYEGLGRVYINRGRLAEAEELFNKAIEVNPYTDKMYTRLSWFYIRHGKFDKAEEVARRAIKFNPRNGRTYAGLGWFYLDQNKFNEAERIFKEAIKLNPKSSNAYATLAILYGRMGNKALSEEYNKKAKSFYGRFYPPMTINSYRLFKEIVNRRKIRWICVQYPMRSVEPLKKILGGADGVIFVDNEGIFKNAVLNEGYTRYFKDIFAGDFGHCNEKGNKLLAKNIADVILKEVFNK